MAFEWSLSYPTCIASRGWKEGEGKSGHVRPVSLLIVEIERYINIKKGEFMTKKRSSVLLDWWRLAIDDKKTVIALGEVDDEYARDISPAVCPLHVRCLASSFTSKNLVSYRNERYYETCMP